MSRKHIQIGGLQFGIVPDDDEKVVRHVKDAMDSGTTADLVLLDNSDRQVRVLVNGKALEAVVFDLDLDPKPSETTG